MSNFQSIVNYSFVFFAGFGLSLFLEKIAFFNAMAGLLGIYVMAE